MWQYVIGGALLAGGAAANMKGASMATKAGARVIRAETARQEGMNRELDAKTGEMIAEISPTGLIAQENAQTDAAASEMAATGDQVQAGASANGAPEMSAGTKSRVMTAARALARRRAQRANADRSNLIANQYEVDRSRIAQRSRDSQAIAGVEAVDASRSGQGWRDGGGLMSGAGLITMMA